MSFAHDFNSVEETYMPVESTRRIQNFAYEIEVSGYRLIADVPVGSGGSNQGPDPHDYLQTALAACTVLTMQLYADKKGIPLESADVKVKITEEGSDNRMHREIRLIGKLSDEQKQRLLEIADKCPIHRFLSRGAKIETVAVS
jgi:putative redox protein